MAVGTSPRIVYLDGLRAFLMLFGIPYHAALAFSGQPWLVRSEQDSAFLWFLAEFLHVWRMPAFFVIAGFFSALILRRRGPGAWFRGRLRRLGIPLVTGVLLLWPAQWWAIGYSRMGSHEGAVSYMADAAWPPSSAWTIHLWFLVNLLLYSAVLALAASPWLRRYTGAVARVLVARFVARPGVCLTVFAATSVVLVTVGLAGWEHWHLRAVTNGLVARTVLLFAPAFLLGVLLGSRDGLLDRLARIPLRAVVPVAAAAVGAVLAARSWPTLGSGGTVLMEGVAWTVGGLGMTVLVLRVAPRLFPRPRAWVTWLVDASLPVYLIHMPLVLVSSLLLIRAGVDGVVGWLIVVSVTLVGSLAFYEVANRVPWARYAVNGSHKAGKSIHGHMKTRLASWTRN
ncbi:acyltransferase family protein [Demequina zhanjiangensis]|uniref:Acyltransferase family protein n=1 Tax=Demequina zhanjiangensis TaxID=3051659 RepID=A0ABT8FZ35_9MICO|nr:acyltransferase family protein [Demequina sp. SYSU T00b26]MDN4472027.1 acyltransferase family protein [Demequina sp. SYSU T00b26]